MTTPEASPAAEASRWTLSALGRLLEQFEPEHVGNTHPALSDVSQDSRQVTPGTLFVVRGGTKTHGARFVEDALARGAVAVLREREFGLAPLSSSESGMPELRVNDVASALGVAAEAVHGYPSRALDLVGITGTNGKTTTASLVRQCLVQLGKPTALLGTLGFEFEGEPVETGLTTPEPDVVSRLFASAVKKGARHAVMEVSSHALAQHRVDALQFAVAAFTNLTQDHLDFHRSLDEYAAAKARLFVELNPKESVINVDDPYGKELAARVEKNGGNVWTVSRNQPSTIQLVQESATALGRCLELETPQGRVEFETRVIGAHNVENWLVCVGVLGALGCDLSALSDVGPSVQAAPGRFERCDLPGDDIVVVVDYAHTPDALRRVLIAARPFTARRLICVFGCGGDRDPSKRAIMGAVAASGADHVVITNDNPRSEDPEQIARAIEQGVRATAGAQYTLCLDRAQAIERSIRQAEAGDLVLIAGKGHEDYQIVGEQKSAFDDRNEARRALALRRMEANPFGNSDS